MAILAIILAGFLVLVLIGVARSKAAKAAKAKLPPEERWRRLLTQGHPPLRNAQRMMRHLPSPPRCKLCFNPFGGIAGRMMRLMGFKPSRKNPNFCSRCCDMLPPGGAEVEVTVLFADVRGSTGLAEGRSAAEFARLLNRFYATVTDVMVRHDAIVDKLIGDEIMALFVPGFAGPEYRRRAAEAAVELLRAVGYGSGSEPWLQVGVGVNAGIAYVGNVGDKVMDFTALGDTVNVAARLQDRAASGEVLLSDDVHAACADLFPTGEHRTLAVAGREEPVAVVAAHV
jgi:adenylate cyclase